MNHSIIKHVFMSNPTRGFMLATFFATLVSLSIFPSIKAVETPPIQWSIRFNIAGEGYSIIQTTDGGYAIAGGTGGKFFLLKTNQYGDFKWQRTYADGGVAYARAFSKSVSLRLMLHSSR